MENYFVWEINRLDSMPIFDLIEEVFSLNSNKCTNRIF